MTAEMWRLRIDHRTVHTYPSPVTSSYNEIRMHPRDEPGQWVLASTVELEPFEGSLRYTDYFGTQVTAFDLHRPHTTLGITVTSTVETGGIDPPADVPALDWAELAAEPVVDRWAEYLMITPLTTLNTELLDFATAVRDRTEPAAAAAEICDWVHGQLTYTPGVTGVHTSAADAWKDRRGVCQDFSHLAAGLLRTIGIPARYVSGYLLPDTEAEFGVPVPGESHAWVEYFTGSWHGFDPTNAVTPGLGHVVTGRGRDYRDVPPLRGLYAGPSASDTQVEVLVTRLR